LREGETEAEESPRIVLYTLQSTSYSPCGSTAGESFGSVGPMELVPSDDAAYLSPALYTPRG